MIAPCLMTKELHCANCKQEILWFTGNQPLCSDCFVKFQNIKKHDDLVEFIEFGLHKQETHRFNTFRGKIEIPFLTTFSRNGKIVFSETTSSEHEAWGLLLHFLRYGMEGICSSDERIKWLVKNQRKNLTRWLIRFNQFFESEKYECDVYCFGKSMARLRVFLFDKEKSEVKPARKILKLTQRLQEWNDGSLYDSLNSMTKQYLETALWAETDESDESGGEPLDNNYSLYDIDPESIVGAKKDCDAFYEKAQEKIGDVISEIDLTDLGHDFWLTRNGHGAGFFDGDYDEFGDTVGDDLTQVAKEFGEVYIYVGDDGKLYIDKG